MRGDYECVPLAKLVKQAEGAGGIGSRPVVLLINVQLVLERRGPANFESRALLLGARTCRGGSGGFVSAGRRRA